MLGKKLKNIHYKRKRYGKQHDEQSTITKCKGPWTENTMNPLSWSIVAKYSVRESSVRRMCHTAKVPYGDNSARQKMLTTKILYTIKSVWWNIYGKKSYGENSYGDNSYCENSGHAFTSHPDRGNMRWNTQFHALRRAYTSSR